VPQLGKGYSAAYASENPSLCLKDTLHLRSETVFKFPLDISLTELFQFPKQELIPLRRDLILCFYGV